MAPNIDGEDLSAVAPVWKGFFDAGAFEAGFFAKGLGCEVEELEGVGANGLRKASSPLFWGAVAAGFAPNGFDEDDEGFGSDEKGFDAKGEAADVCEAGGQPLPPKEDIVFVGGDGHLGRYSGISPQSQSLELQKLELSGHGSYIRNVMGQGWGSPFVRDEGQR